MKAASISRRTCPASPITMTGRRPWLSPQLIYEALVNGPVITPSCKSMARWSFTAQRSTTRWSLTL